MDEICMQFGAMAARDVQELQEHYDQVKLLAYGGQAVIYAGQLKHVASEMIYKKYAGLSKTSVKQWENAYRELYLLTSVGHPNILRLSTAFTFAKTPEEFDAFYVEAPLAGISLKNLIEIEQRFNIHRVWMIMKQILDGLAYLHEYEIIHRDLHTENFVVDENYHITIIDFGLSTEHPDEVVNASELTTYVTAVHYRAPEVIIGGKYTKAVNIWAVGCIFFELITGERLFEDQDEVRVWHKQVELFGMPSADFLAQFEHLLNIEEASCGNISLEDLLPSDSFVNAYEPDLLNLCASPDGWCLYGHIRVDCCTCESKVRASYAENKKEVPKDYEKYFTEPAVFERRPWKNFAHHLTIERLPEINAFNARKLFAQMMCIVPQNRISAQSAFNHPFIGGEAFQALRVPQKFSYLLGSKPIESVEVWQMLLFDHLQRCNGQALIAGHTFWDRLLPHSCRWLPSFQTDEKDDVSCAEHILSYTVCAFRPFNETKLVVRVMLADYRGVVEKLKQPSDYVYSTYEELYVEYIDLIYSTDANYEKRYANYATSIRKLVNQHSQLSLLIIDDSDMQGFERYHHWSSSRTEMCGRLTHKFALRLNAFIKFLNCNGVQKYEMHFAQMTLGGSVLMSRDVHQLIYSLNLKLTNLPSSLMLALVDDVKFGCGNYSNLAESVYGHHMPSFYSMRHTLIVGPIDELSMQSKQNQRNALLYQFCFSEGNRVAKRSNDELYCNEYLLSNAPLRLEEKVRPYKQLICTTESKVESYLKVSSDGRHMYALTWNAATWQRWIAVFDLVNNTQKIFTPKHRDFEKPDHFVIVGLTTILCYQFKVLCMIRLCSEEETYDVTVLDEDDWWPKTYVFTEICGKDVNVKHTVLSWCGNGRPHFVRLDVETGRLQTDWKEERQNPGHQYFLSYAGNILYAMHPIHCKTIYAFDLTAKTWTENEVTADVDHTWLFHCGSCPPNEYAYFNGYKDVDNYTAFAWWFSCRRR
ncbi:Stress-activated protein kinase JNK [Aphelenchoides fujianensis]|nr:Stress-activated protein kinase JNK [Aphelenchoides fujianensis]